MRKLNKKHLTIFGLGIFIVIGIIIFLIRPRQVLELKGKCEETIPINANYDDPGVNIKEAQKIGGVDTTQEGTYTIVYQYGNQEVTRTIKVVDNHRVIMNINGSTDTYVKQGDPYIESGCHVIDKKEGNLTSRVKKEGQVDTQKVGDYKITYTVETDDGLIVKKERQVHVVDAKDFLGNNDGIPVLMYHYVYTDQDVPQKLNVNYIKDTELEKQLQYFQKENYYYPSYQELQAYVEGRISLPKKSIILTFDDAQKGFLKYGIPLLEKYKIPATSFVIGIKDGEKKVKDYASEYISFQSHSYNMHHGGGNIGHGGIVSALKQNEIVEDLKKAQIIVQNSEAFAYPYGDVTEIAQKAIKETDILCAFTTQYGKVKKGMDVTALPRIRVTGTNSLEAFQASIK